MARGKDQGLAEAAHILKGQGEAVFQGEIQVHMGFVVGGHAQEQPAGHAQVNEQGNAALQVKEQVFAPPGKPLQAAAREGTR